MRAENRVHGTRSAVLKRSGDRIHILALNGKDALQITVGGWKSLPTVDWARVLLAIGQ